MVIRKQPRRSRHRQTQAQAQRSCTTEKQQQGITYANHTCVRLCCAVRCGAVRCGTVWCLLCCVVSCRVVVLVVLVGCTPSYGVVDSYRNWYVLTTEHLLLYHLSFLLLSALAWLLCGHPPPSGSPHTPHIRLSVCCLSVCLSARRGRERCGQGVIAAGRA